MSALGDGLRGATLELVRHVVPPSDFNRSPGPRILTLYSRRGPQEQQTGGRRYGDDRFFFHDSSWHPREWDPAPNR
jgi:hypothetical protein